MEMDFNAVIHAVASDGKRIWLNAPSLSQYVESYPIEDAIDPKEYNVISLLGHCPKLDDWKSNCDGSCGTLNAKVTLKRGKLKQGKTPEQNYNYRWSIASISISGVTDEHSETLTKSETGNLFDAEPINTPASPKTSNQSTQLGKMDFGDMAQLRRELISNDRTAIIQAGAEEGWEETAEGIATWLNQRTVAYFNNLVSALTVDGAVLTQVRHKSDKVFTPTSKVINRPKLDEWLIDNDISQDRVKHHLKGIGLSTLAEWENRFPDETIEGFAKWIVECEQL